MKAAPLALNRCLRNARHGQGHLGKEQPGLLPDRPQTVILWFLSVSIFCKAGERRTESNSSCSNLANRRHWRQGAKVFQD